MFITCSTIPMSRPRMSIRDRKSTRLNSSHLGNSYAVFCLKKKTNRCRRRFFTRSALSRRMNLFNPMPSSFFTATCPCAGRALSIFFFNDTATPEIYTLSLHDALPISQRLLCVSHRGPERAHLGGLGQRKGDRKSTRLNSSHLGISYAVFCLKKKI